MQGFKRGNGTGVKYLFKPVTVLVRQFHKTNTICNHEACTGVVSVESDRDDRVLKNACRFIRIVIHFR